MRWPCVFPLIAPGTYIFLYLLPYFKYQMIITVTITRMIGTLIMSQLLVTYSTQLQHDLMPAVYHVTILLSVTWFMLCFLQNEKALAEEENAGDYASLKEADKYCKAILGRLSRGHGYIRSLFIVSAALAAGAVIISQKEYWDLQKLSAMLNLPPS